MLKCKGHKIWVVSVFFLAVLDSLSEKTERSAFIYLEGCTENININGENFNTRYKKHLVAKRISADTRLYYLTPQSMECCCWNCLTSFSTVTFSVRNMCRHVPQMTITKHRIQLHFWVLGCLINTRPQGNIEADCTICQSSTCTHAFVRQDAVSDSQLPFYLIIGVFDCANGHVYKSEISVTQYSLPKEFLV